MRKALKNILLILLFIFVVTLNYGCARENTPEIVNEEIRLPNLEGMSRKQIKTKLDKLGVNYEFAFVSDHVSEEEMDKFVEYSHNLEAGQVVDKDDFFYVYTTVLPLTFANHENLKIEFEYEGKSFINDGVGEVTLVRTIDGDTAYFRDITGEEVKVRFLCINTPESTKEHDPWGKAASNFTASFLSNAKKIVLESEMDNRVDVYGRYLGYVWVDGVLLNLILVEQAYTNSSYANSKYRSFFLEASIEAQLTGRRFYGEIDPDYDYEIGDFK